MQQRPPDAGTKPLDPVALSFAIWLGLVVGALGLERLSEQAALKAQNAPQDSAARLSPGQVYAARGG